MEPGPGIEVEPGPGLTCGSRCEIAVLETLPLDLTSAPKCGVHTTRTATPADTLARVRTLVREIPITRISDLTPLDPLRFPVFVAVTPLAKDLTTHAGKGVDAQSARASAVMEAIERVSAETHGSGQPVVASFGRLSSSGAVRALDPRRFDLPADSRYRADEPISWLEGYELFRREAALLPRDLVVSPPNEGVLLEVDTNGLASGNGLLEAVVHGLCEVIERDAIGALEFTTQFGDSRELYPELCTLREDTLPAEAARWCERARALGQRLIVQALLHDLGVPTFRSVLVDPDYPTASGRTSAYFPGFGTHPDKYVALSRSVNEALQSRVGFVHGGRDSFNELPQGTRAAARRTRLWGLFRARSIDFAELASSENRELGDDLAFLLRRLSAVGLEQAVATDLTRPDWGVSVVRVRVPGLSSFLVNRRRVGWRNLKHLI